MISFRAPQIARTTSVLLRFSTLGLIAMFLRRHGVSSQKLIGTLRLLPFASSNQPSVSRQKSNLVVFDRETKRKQRNWAASQKKPEIYEYVLKEIGYRVADRVYDITDFFDIAVDIGAGRGHIAPHVFKENIGHLIQVDMSSKMIETALESPEVQCSRVVADEETIIFSPNSIDLFLSSLSIHWINDLPGFFSRCFQSLREDGAIVGAMFGGETLYELRCSLQLAEMERCGGVGSHISPFAQVSDIASLMNRAGFRMLTLDSEELVVGYPDPYSLMYDLQGMAQSGAAWNRSKSLNRDVALSSAAIYKQMYGNQDGTFPATFQIIYVIGWKPGPRMAKPAPRGSGTVSFKDLDKLPNLVS